MAVGLENKRVALNGAEHFPATGEAEFPVEFSGLVEKEDVLGLFGEEFFGFCEESKAGVALDNVFEFGDPGVFVLDGLCSWAVSFLAFFLMFFGGFGDEE